MEEIFLFADQIPEPSEETEDPLHSNFQVMVSAIILNTPDPLFNQD